MVSSRILKIHVGKMHLAHILCCVVTITSLRVDVDAVRSLPTKYIDDIERNAGNVRFKLDMAVS